MKHAWRMAESGAAPVTLLLVLLVLLGLSHSAPAANASSSAFLAEQLPLKPLVSTPVSILRPAYSGEPVSVTGRQAITVVFSRPVIALGSDFGQQDNYGGKVPFILSCAQVPGKFRWATTTIARWDPDVDWPSDLDCAFTWNTSITSYDGLPLQLPPSAPPVRRLSTAVLQGRIEGVVSASACALTGCLWSASTGMPGDKLPEVPDDGVVWLSFTYPVNLALLQSALLLEATSGWPRRAVPITVTRCVTPAPWAVPPPTPRPLAQALNATPEAAEAEACAEVRLNASLAVDGNYTLRLPAGSRYNGLSGPLGSELVLALGGLRRFKVPLRQDFQQPRSAQESVYDGTRYNRLDAWLPHGLDPSARLQEVVSAIDVCRVEAPWASRGSTCTPLGFNLSRPAPGRLRLAVPDLKPKDKIRVSVSANADIKDGFGLPLQASSNEFWTMDVYPYFQGPTLNNDVGLLDSTAGNASLQTTWPFLALGSDPNLQSAGTWPLTVDSDEAVGRLVRAMAQGDVNTPDLLGSPAASVSRPGASASSGPPTELSLPLDPSRPLHLVHTCCSMQYYPTQRKVSAQRVLISRAPFTASWVLSFPVAATGGTATAWVTDNAPGGGPVEGATAYVYLDSYNVEPTLAGVCTTSADGVCTVAMPPAQSARSQRVVGVVRVGREVSYLPDLGYWYPGQDNPYVGTLVADRLMVKPGDTLHVAGFLQQRNGSSLGLPNTTVGLLEISPGWTGAAPSLPTQVPVDISPDVGTFRVNVSVPSTATPAKYTATLWVSPTGQLPNADDSTTSAAGSAAVKQGRRRLHQAASIGFAGGMASEPLVVSSAAAVRGGVAGSTAYTGAAVSSVALRGLMVNVASLGLTVSDPRPPTVDLTVTTPAWAQPNGSVPVSVLAVSYLGANVGGAAMGVIWKTAKAQGVQNLTTGADGTGSTVIDLSSLPAANQTTDGDTLSVEVEWVGPTRERIVRSNTVNLRSAARTVSITRSLLTALPGTAFGVTANVTDNANGSDVPGLLVRVTLEPNATAGDAACAGQPGATQSCTVTSGSPDLSACQLALPCTGTFVLTACAPATANSSAAGSGSSSADEACTRMSLGRNASSWALAPLTGFDTPQLIADKQRYALGSSAVLRFQNPWPSATALATWGNKERLSTTVLRQLPPGPASITLPLGPECAGGCTVTVLLSAPRRTITPAPAGGAITAGGSSAGGMPLPADVPVSRLFDAAGPVVAAMQTSLDVVEDRVLNVTLRIDTNATATNTSTALSDPSDDPADPPVAAVLPPGSTSRVVVGVVGPGGVPAAGTEVTVIAVDKAILDLIPYPLPNLTDALALRWAAQLTATEGGRNRLAPGAVDAVFSTLMRRLTADPWLPTEAGVQPQQRLGTLPQPTFSTAPVDLNDTVYLSRYTTPITYMPSDSSCSLTGSCPPSLLPGGGLPRGVAYDLVGESMVAAKALPMAAGVVATAMVNEGARGAGTNGLAGTPGTTPRLASQFLTTPLFTAFRTSADGSGAVEFKAPPNLGTFVIRAYAADGAASRYGSGETRLIVRRPLSLTPSLPRAVRTGDAFQAGVMVTLAGDDTVRAMDDAAAGGVVVTVTAEILPPNATATTTATPPAPLVWSSTQQPTKQTITLYSGGSTGSTAPGAGGTGGRQQGEVRWAFNASALGSGTIRFTADDGSGAVDTLEVQVPVLAQQSDVFVATSFALRGNGSEQRWAEGLQLPEAVPGSGSLDLLAGVGHLPAVTALIDSVTAVPRDDPDGSSSVIAAVTPAVLAAYQQPLTAVQAANATAAYAALSGPLNGSTTLGLLGQRIGKFGYNPDRVDVVLNLWAAWMVGSYPEDAVPASSETLSPRWATARTALAPMWRDAAARQLVADATFSRQPQYGVKPGPYSDFYTLAWARLVLGATWTPPGCNTPAASAYGGVCADATVQQDLSLSRLVQEAPKQALAVQLLTALALMAGGDDVSRQYGGFVGEVTERVVSWMRVQGRTAYVAAGEGSRTAAGRDTQALALLLLIQAAAGGNQSAQSAAPLTQKLAAHVAGQQQRGGGGGGGFGSYAPCLVITPSPMLVGLMTRALTAYDQASGSATPDLALTADVQGEVLMQAAFTPANTSLASSSTPWEALPSPPGQLTFNVSGTGEASLTASLHFVPVALLPFPTYRGIWVESAVQMVDKLTNEAVGPALGTVPLSSIVMVTLQVTSPDDLGAVTVEALLPGGLEAVDPNVATDSRAGGGAACIAEVVGVNWRSFFWGWVWPMCPVQETRPSSVTYRYSRLMAGTSSLQFRAVAATSGTFTLPPVKAWAEAQPEVMGMTAGGTLVICDAAAATATAPCAPQPVRPPAPARACPNDCSGNGACNIAEGTCLCQAGFVGADCSAPVE